MREYTSKKELKEEIEKNMKNMMQNLKQSLNLKKTKKLKQWIEHPLKTSLINWAGLIYY